MLLVKNGNRIVQELRQLLKRRLKMKNSYKNFEITIVDDPFSSELFDASAEEKDLHISIQSGMLRILMK